MEEPLMYQNLRRLINVIDELRDVGLQQYINLPRICVVGTQSAGKSSVLEAIVGMDFLPRGEGIVTRRPLELRLVHEPSTTPNGNHSWALFETRKDKMYTNFEEVRRVIDELTEEVAGRNKGIVDDPIVLTVHSDKCPDLTLIDLPGITRVPLKGSDQTDDIERLTRDMATRYAKDPRTIVLAVVPANADMSTSDALQLARRVDPKGIRTIGVITKIDLMDRGTDASRMLNGDEVPLRLGYTGVRNRSQADIKEKKSIEEAIKVNMNGDGFNCEASGYRKAKKYIGDSLVHCLMHTDSEKDFFMTHPVYRTLPPHMLGTQSLVEKLTRVLFRHIRTYLPEIKREIGNRMRSVQNRLDELGSGVPIDPQEKVQLMWSMITDYCEIYRNTIRGKFDKKLQTYFEHHDITSGAQIRSIFNELLVEYVANDVTQDMSDYDIDLAIRMHEGDSLPGFPSPDTFEYLILPHLRKVQAPVFDCLDRVTQSLELLSQTIANRVFGRFPKLSEQVLEQSSAIIVREKENTKQILESLVTAEIGYLFTNDSSYLTQHGSMIPMNEKQGSQPEKSSRPFQPDNQPLGAAQTPQLNGATPQSNATANAVANAQAVYSSLQNTVTGMWTGGQDRKKTHYSASFIKEIRERLDAYFNIVLRNIRDSVPKIIGCFLVRQLQDKLQFELYNDLNKAERLSDLLGEPPQIMEERESLMNQIATFKKATQVLQRDPSITALAISEFDELYDADLAQLQHQASGGGIPPAQSTASRSINQQLVGGHPAQMPTQPPQWQANGAPQMQPALHSMPMVQQPPSQPVQPQAPSAANLWGLRTGSKGQETKKAGGSLFGDRPQRGDVSSVFADPKTNNPLYG